MSQRLRARPEEEDQRPLRFASRPTPRVGSKRTSSEPVVLFLIRPNANFDRSITQRKKNLSIPLTISRVLKYIPELQRQVERLQQRKEEILLALSRPEEQSHCGDIVVYRPMVSAACLSNREVMVQVCLLSSHFSISFSKILRLLKREELHLVNASTYTTHDGRCFCSLHIEVSST